jgi:hypothetical protein
MENKLSAVNMSIPDQAGAGFVPNRGLQVGISRFTRLADLLLVLVKVMSELDLTFSSVSHDETGGDWCMLMCRCLCVQIRICFWR